MSEQLPDSSFPEQGSAQEVAERSEPRYLSSDSEDEEEKEEEAFTSGAPGFATVSSFLAHTYGIQNPAFVARNAEIENMQRVCAPPEDRKLSPSLSSSSNHGSDSDSEAFVEKPKKKVVRYKLKISEKERKETRIKNNVEHGLNKKPKTAKKAHLWEYTEQKLSPDLVVQILPLPESSFVFRKVMTMKEVEKEVPRQTVDNSLLTVLNKFGVPTSKLTNLRDIQTEYCHFVMFRRVVVRKRLSAGKYSYAVMPNMVISTKRKVYHKTQDGVWYEKTTTNNRPTEMAIPLPFKGNQSVDVLFENTFSWEEV